MLATKIKKEIKKIIKESEFQDKCGEFVNRHVQQPIGQLIYELQEKGHMQEDIWDMFGGPKTKYICGDCDFETYEYDETQNHSEEHQGEEKHQDFAEEEESNEVYEYWLVDDYLYHKLKEEGYLVNDDWFGLTIWGRTCTGQAIKVDGIIRQIVRKELEEEGYTVKVGWNS